MMEPGIEQRKGRSRSPIAALCGSPEAEKATSGTPDLANFMNRVVEGIMNVTLQIAVTISQ